MATREQCEELANQIWELAREQTTLEESTIGENVLSIIWRVQNILKINLIDQITKGDLEIEELLDFWKQQENLFNYQVFDKGFLRRVLKMKRDHQKAKKNALRTNTGSDSCLPDNS